MVLDFRFLAPKQNCDVTLNSTSTTETNNTNEEQISSEDSNDEQLTKAGPSGISPAVVCKMKYYNNAFYIYYFLFRKKVIQTKLMFKSVVKDIWKNLNGSSRKREEASASNVKYL